MPPQRKLQPRLVLTFFFMSVSIVSNHTHHQSPGIQREFDLFHPLTSVTTEWHRCKDQPKLPREESTQSVLVNDELYISDPHRPVLYKYSIDKKSWYKLQTDVSNYALVTYHSKVVLIRGLKNGVYTDKCVTVLDDSDLEEKLNRTCPREFQFQNARATSNGKYLVVIDRSKVNTVWLFDGEKWTPITVEGNLSLATEKNFQIVINDGQVYVFLSRCTYRTSFDTLTKPVVNSSLKWEELKTTVPSKSNVTKVGNQLVTVEESGNKLDVYAYSIKSKAWVKVEDVNVSFQSIVSVIGVPSIDPQPKQLEMWVVGRTLAYGEREKVKVFKVIFCGELYVIGRVCNVVKTSVSGFDVITVVACRIPLTPTTMCLSGMVGARCLSYSLEQPQW